jgi:shikimate dehydrogenase
MKCGVLGRKLGHSYSPQIHKHLGDYEYHIFEKEPEELVDFLQNGDFSGINVTIPYKKDVISYLDEISPIAQKLRAVNIIVRRDGKLIGHNSDHFGFKSMVEKSGLSPAGKKCLVLGSGGASATVQSVLKDLGAEVVVISRSGENNYDNLHLHQDAAIIVNTTPLGMYPHTGEAPLNVAQFPQLEGVLDIVYNPARTQIMLDAEKLGIPTMNGLWMLVAQAKEAAEWFTNSVISDEKISEIYEILRRQMENIILIGMPGCGKSTVGKQLAEITGKEFVDADEKIAQLAGKPIPEIFAQDGEEVFRSFETKALEELGKRSGLVIATGGGCVTKERNYPLLHQNGTIIWLKRNLDQLPTDGRPLSQANDLTMMYETRKPMYEAFADYAIDNNDSVTDTVRAIGELI